MPEPHKVTIEITPAFAAPNHDFDAALNQAYAARQSTFTYKDVEFRIRYNDDGGFCGVAVVLTDADAPLPSVFDGEMIVQFVVLLCEIPETLLAKSGWYVGLNFGYPGARCAIDPKGETNDGTPIIYANGDNFADVTGLFNKVMTGELEPGYNGNPHSGRIYRTSTNHTTG